MYIFNYKKNPKHITASSYDWGPSLLVPLGPTEPPKVSLKDDWFCECMSSAHRAHCPPKKKVIFLIRQNSFDNCGSGPGEEHLCQDSFRLNKIPRWSFKKSSFPIFAILQKKLRQKWVWPIAETRSAITMVINIPTGETESDLCL